MRLGWGRGLGGGEGEGLGGERGEKGDKERENGTTNLHTVSKDFALLTASPPPLQ